MQKAPLILLTEDEATVREVVRKYLERDNFRVVEAANGREGLRRVKECQPDLIVLDIMLPELDGFEFIRLLRNSTEPDQLHLRSIPIIVLSARKEEVDRIFGFNLGVDDYVVKPFSAMEVVARIHAVLRRSQSGNGSADAPLSYGDLTIDPLTRRVTRCGAPVALTAREFDLLFFFARHPGQIFSRAQLIEELWGYEFVGGENTVTVRIRRLREKLEPNAAEPTYIHTVHGVGYCFDPMSEAPR